MRSGLRYPLSLVLIAALAAEGPAAGILGDADSDGDIDGDDLIAVQTSFGNVGLAGLLGDADCDGDVDSDDLIAVNGGLYFGGSPDTEATFEFSDPDLNETFDVYFSTPVAGSAGLALYGVVIDGLDGTPIEPSSIVWQENTLGNFNEEFEPRGIQPFDVIASPVGTDTYSATNSQVRSPDPLFGIGQTPIDEPDNPLVPTDEPVQLGVPALLGQLTIPGFYQIPREQGLALLRPDALLFTTEGDNSAVESPLSVAVELTGPHPLLGDPDGDGDIDGDDLIAVQSNFGATGPFPLLGDADFDGDVDGDDLILFQANFGAVAAAVPEPTTTALLLLTMSPALRTRRR